VKFSVCCPALICDRFRARFELLPLLKLLLDIDTPFRHRGLSSPAFALGNVSVEGFLQIATHRHVPSFNSLLQRLRGCAPVTGYFVAFLEPPRKQSSLALLLLYAIAQRH